MKTDEETRALIQEAERSDEEELQAVSRLEPPLFMTETSIRRELAETILPLSISGILQSVEDAVRLSVISRLGVDGLAADGLYRTTFGFVIATDAGFLSPLDALISTAYGKEEYGEIGKILRQAWLFGTALSIPPAIVLLCAEPLLNLFGQDPEITSLIGPYARAAAGACIPLFSIFVDTAFLKGTRSFKSLIALSTTSATLGIGLSYLLIAGNTSDPKKALLHSGYVTLIQAWVQFLGLKTLFCTKEFKRYEIYKKSMDYKYLKKMLGVGSPMTVSSLAEQAKYFLIGLMMGRLGKIQLAVNQATMVYVQFFMPPAFAIRQASTLFVSKYKGGGDFVRMRRMGNIGIVFEASIYIIPLIAYATIPKYLATRYIPEEDIQDLDTFVRLAFITNVLARILESMQGSVTATAKGMLDTLWPSVIWVVNSLAVALPFSYLFAFTFGWDLVGLNAAASLSAAASLPPLFWRWCKLSHTVEIESHVPLLSATPEDIPVILRNSSTSLRSKDRSYGAPANSEPIDLALPGINTSAEVVPNTIPELEFERATVDVNTAETPGLGVPILRMYEAHVTGATALRSQEQGLKSSSGKSMIRYKE